MSTAVQARVRRPIGFDTFADITQVPLLLAGGRVDGNGLLFDGELTDEQVEAVWWRATSRDDADEATRRAIYDLLSTTDPPVVDALARFALGL